MNKIICIVGPTASGKTGFSIELAKFLKKKLSENMQNSLSDVVIINADSRQLYKDFPIITAQPTKEEQEGIEHKLFGIAETYEQSTVGIWLDKVHTEIENAYANNAIPLLVGGTGMYIKALTEGIAQIPKISDEISEKIKVQMQEKGLEKMYAKLYEVDKVYAQKIHQNDRQRIMRALEVYEFTGKSLSEWHSSAHAQSRYISHKIGIGLPLSPNDELTPLLQKRIDLMLEMGALEEAEKAYEKCADISLPGWTGIGCIELGNYIKGIYTLEEAKELWQKNTRAYAKRQWTWFRADKTVNWAHPFDKEKRSEFLAKVLDFININ